MNVENKINLVRRFNRIFLVMFLDVISYYKVNKKYAFQFNIHNKTIICTTLIFEKNQYVLKKIKKANCN